VVRGPQVFTGYWKNDKATAEAFCDIDGKRYFRTGDLGRTDEDGYFYISDRLKRMINAAGMKVWPAEVEALMYQHPAIKECCIIASPDERRGETVKLVAVIKQDQRVTAEELISWARSRMAAYKLPRRIEFTDALPRTASGKLMWRALQEKEFEPRSGPPAERGTH
jgi:fatty-acyl-CoA synthase